MPEQPRAPEQPRGPARAAKGRLALTKASRGSRFRAGDRIAYMLRVVNRSRRAVRDVRVCDALPDGVAVVSATRRARMVDGRHCWTFRSLRAGERRQLRIVVRVLAGAPSRIVNRARATSPDTRPATARHADRVIRSSGDVRAGGVTG
nr:hypothetical protein [Conexibacter arvalis]